MDRDGGGSVGLASAGGEETAKQSPMKLPAIPDQAPVTQTSPRRGVNTGVISFEREDMKRQRSSSLF